ncbi:MAG: cell division protein ZapA [Veillonellales bacterium]
MDEKICKITVEIFGESYALKGDLEAERVKRIAALVDERMKQVAKTDSRLSPSKVAVLAALNLADDFLRLEQDYQQLIQMVKEEK